MRKFLATVGNVLAYLFIYLGIQFRVIELAAIPVSVINFKRPEAVSQFITKYAYEITTFAAFIALLFYIAIFIAREQSLLKRCELRKVKITTVILIILCSISISAASSSFVAQYAYKFKSYIDVAEGISIGSQSIITMFCVVILMPIFEEILFRGLVFKELANSLNNKLKWGLGATISVLIQALIFGTFHMNLLQGIYTFFLGIALALIYMWTKSLWAPILLHFSYNLLGTSIMPKLLYNNMEYIEWYGYVGFAATIIFIVLIFLNEKKRFYSVAQSI